MMRTLASVLLLTLLVAADCQSSGSAGGAFGRGAGGVGGSAASGASGQTGGAGTSSSGGTADGDPAGAAGSGAADSGAADSGAAGGEASGGAGSAGLAGSVDDGVGTGGLAGSAGTNGGQGGTAGSAARKTFAYVSTLNGGLLTCSLDPDTGAPSLLGPARNVPAFLHGAFVSHSGKFLYVLTEPAQIETYRIGADGTLPATPSSVVAVDDKKPLLTLTLDPKDRFLYAASPFSGLIYVFAVDAATGGLRSVAAPLPVGHAPNFESPTYLAAEPSGNFVYLTQQADSFATAADEGIRGYRVDQTTGALSELAESPFGGAGLFAGAIVFRPDGKFLFSSGAGLNAFAIDALSGNLTRVTGSPFSDDVGSDPWATNLAIAPRGDFVYVSHFLLTEHVSAFSIDPLSGALEPVRGSAVTSSAPYSIAIEPGGRFLYVGNDSGELSVFSRLSDGSLSPIEHSPFQLGGLEAEIAFATRP